MFDVYYDLCDDQEYHLPNNTYKKLNSEPFGSFVDAQQWAVRDSLTSFRRITLYHIVQEHPMALSHLIGAE